MAEPVVVIKDLSKQFDGITAVSNVSFEISHGEIFSLLGPNGAGKTTLISILSCLLQPSSGNAWIGGYSVISNSFQVKQQIGVIPQDLAIYEPLSARQNLIFWGRMYGMGGKQLSMRVDEVLEQVSLTDRANDRVEKFSGGMKRRLNLAVGLLHKPKLVFMDEPTVGIDPQNRRNILDMVKDLRDQGMTVLYTTHYMEEAAELSDRVGIIDHGELIASGNLKELTAMLGELETLRLHFGEEQPGEDIAPIFANLASVETVAAGDHHLILTVRESEDALPGVLAAAHQAGLRIRAIDIEEPNLEAVFLHLTGRALRD